MRGLLRLPLLGVPLVVLCGCSGLSLTPQAGKIGAVPLAKETFTAPVGVLRVRWAKTLVPRQPFFGYNPQEFATAGVSPDGLTVFIGSSDKTLYALRKRDGEVLWQLAFLGGLS